MTDCQRGSQKPGKSEGKALWGREAWRRAGLEPGIDLPFGKTGLEQTRRENGKCLCCQRNRNTDYTDATAEMLNP